MSAALEVSSLTRRYGRRAAVSEVSFRVERGAVFGLLGPNGAGKTTTLACALGLVRPTSGSARVLGEPASRAWSAPGGVGCAFETSPVLPGLGAAQQVEYARRLAGRPRDAGREAAALLERVGLGREADPRKGRRADRFSLGQRRRLALACALVGSPELIVLDEPLAGLDPPGVRAMLALFAELAGEGATLVLSSHRLHELEALLTHAAVLIDGKLAADGSLAELMAHYVRDLIVVASPAQRAHALLTELAAGAPIDVSDVSDVDDVGGVGEADDSRPDARRFRIHGCAERAADFNRALVQAGCQVSALEAQRPGLEAFFDDLVEGAA